MPQKKIVSTKPPVVLVRKKAAKGTGTSTPVQPAPQRAVPAPKPASPVAPPAQPVAQPIPPTAQSQPPVPQPSLAAPAVGDSGPSKRDQEKQARRELVELLRNRWPLAFPRDYRQVRPLALGINKDIAAHLPEQPLGRISNAIGIFQYLLGPAYFRAVLRGGPRYDLDGNPRGEVTAEEQEVAQRDLAAYQERRKLWMQAKRRGHESVQPAETS
jgi:ProP effector